MNGRQVPVDNVLHPAWRDSVVHLIVSQSWDESLPSGLAEQAIHKMTYDRGYALGQLTPDSGAYFDEVCSAND
ncbi:hypothetical protein BO86DRAFT_393857 [Aspergillus japonicus CBS 114.51]|uniref:Uncharacterized protein n=1 Tax=Aspergillus japonicus CBS 114.51 TaxID=1448312 RepID=A0A8T8WJR8_ASPJA|nr:hypothetical protein BO86DRAFT_393857 [Aspergillus japonicus CBS 114.51]RAH75932.1 hypothetical protein BO86DRAFT_393857 [Aspergillus japonicus CBS 114.51]